MTQDFKCINFQINHSRTWLSYLRCQSTTEIVHSVKARMCPDVGLGICNFTIPLLVCDLGQNRKIPICDFVKSSESPGPKLQNNLLFQGLQFPCLPLQCEPQQKYQVEQ